MAEIWKPYPREAILEWIDALLDDGELRESLTDWEKGFVISLKNQLRYKLNLSQAQTEKLEFIYAEKTK